MSQISLGVMINALLRCAGAEHAKAALGKTIASAKLSSDEALVLRFADGTGLRLADEGQSCCEHRYMTTDDDLSYFVDAELRDIEIAEAPDGEGSGECHERQFLRVKTTKGDFTMETHNEHNGYYGGFYIRASAL